MSVAPKKWDGLPRPNEPQWRTSRVSRRIQPPPRRWRMNTAVLLELVGGFAVLLPFFVYALSVAIGAENASASALAFMSRIVSFFVPVYAP